MEIRLKESELKEAVGLWIENEGFSLSDKRVVIDFTAGRAPNGFSAEVETFNTPPPELVAETATTTEPVEVEQEPEVTSGADDSPFIEDNDVKVNGNQQALDLDLD